MIHMKKIILLIFCGMVFLGGLAYGGYMLYQYGYDNGYSNGNIAGYGRGSDAGYSQGVQEGTASGYTEGYGVGYMEAEGEDGPVVYYVIGGDRYHNHDCQYVQGDGVMFTSLDAAIAAGLTPCEVCNPPEKSYSDMSNEEFVNELFGDD